MSVVIYFKNKMAILQFCSKHLYLRLFFKAHFYINGYMYTCRQNQFKCKDINNNLEK